MAKELFIYTPARGGRGGISTRTDATTPTGYLEEATYLAFEAIGTGPHELTIMVTDERTSKVLHQSKATIVIPADCKDGDEAIEAVRLQDVWCERDRLED